MSNQAWQINGHRLLAKNNLWASVVPVSSVVEGGGCEGQQAQVAGHVTTDQNVVARPLHRFDRPPLHGIDPQRGLSGAADVIVVVIVAFTAVAEWANQSMPKFSIRRHH